MEAKNDDAQIQPNDEPNEVQQVSQPTQTSKNRIPIILALIVGVCLLLYIYLQGIGARTASDPNTLKEPFSATLVCSECASEGIEINVWQFPGSSRGSVVYSLPHTTLVKVIDQRTADDGRIWYQVEYGGKRGWVKEDFIRK